LALVVQKFGGTSVATAERIMAAARRAIRARQAGYHVVVVVSARGDTTDELIALAHEITDRPPSRELDMLLATGEQVSIALMAMAIQALGHPAISFTGAQIGIVTDSFHTRARIKNISTRRLRQALAEGNIAIVAGFQGVNDNFDITTLGRGGSDTTAVALAAVLKHDPAGPFPEVDCEIYTDVDGVYTTDPRLVPEARKIPAISYDEMLELASLGAGVMHSRSIEFAKKYDVPIHVRSSFTDAEGTWIVPETAWMHQVPVCGLAMVRDEARVHLAGVPDLPGVSHRIFSALADAHLVVDMIAQNVGSAGRAEIGFTVLQSDLSQALTILEPLAREWGASLTYEERLCKVSLVGAGMKTHTGVAQRVFQVLGDAGINIRMITTSPIKISLLVDRDLGVTALRLIHRAFRLHEPRPGEQEWNTIKADILTPRRTVPAPLFGTAGLLSSMEDIIVSDIALEDTHGRITLQDLPDRPGVCAHIFSAIAAAGIVVDMIVQNPKGQGFAELSFTVPRENLEHAWHIARRALQEIHPSGRAIADPDIATVAVEGVGMRSHSGVARRMFGALAQQGINIEMISTSEIRVEVVVERRHAQAALECLRRAFSRQSVCA